MNASLERLLSRVEFSASVLINNRAVRTAVFDKNKRTGKEYTSNLSLRNQTLYQVRADIVPGSLNPALCEVNLSNTFERKDDANNYESLRSFAFLKPQTHKDYVIVK